MYLVLSFLEARILVKMLYWRRAHEKNMEEGIRVEKFQLQLHPTGSFGTWIATQNKTQLHVRDQPLVHQRVSPWLQATERSGCSLLGKAAPIGWGHFTGERSSCELWVTNAYRSWGASEWNANNILCNLYFAAQNLLLSQSKFSPSRHSFSRTLIGHKSMLVGTTSTCPSVAIDCKTITDTHHLPHLSSVLDFPLPLRLLAAGDLPGGLTYSQRACPLLGMSLLGQSYSPSSQLKLLMPPWVIWVPNAFLPALRYGTAAPLPPGLMAWLLWWLPLWLLACWHMNPKVTSGSHSIVLSRALAGSWWKCLLSEAHSAQSC